MRYAALLRGINVGGNKKIAMAELRVILSELGYSDVSTYLQSGNAIFTAPSRPAQALARTLEDCIAGTFGMKVSVVIRTGRELRRIARWGLQHHGLAFSSDGKTLASTGLRGESVISLWDVATGKALQPPGPEGLVRTCPPRLPPSAPARSRRSRSAQTGSGSAAARRTCGARAARPTPR